MMPSTASNPRGQPFGLEKMHFVGLYCIIILQCTVQKRIKNKKV
jgi:hypothetical protein